MPLRPEAASRRVQLAMARGEVPFREGHSVYLNRIEGQVRLRTADGNLTSAGREYIERGGDERLTHLIPPNVETFRRGQQVLAHGIPDLLGARHAFRVHTERPNGEHALTHAGRLFRGHEVNEYVVHVPVWVRYKRGDGWSQPYERQEVRGANGNMVPGSYFTIPMDKIEGLDANTDYADAGEEGFAHIKAATAAWIRRQPVVDGEVILLQQSEVYYFVKPDEDITAKPGWSFDIAQTVRTHGRPQTHVLLNLPRRGIIDMPDEMWGKMKLLHEAIRD